MARKDVRSDNTYLISKNNTDNPKLGAKVIGNGKESLFLDFYFGYKKHYSEKLQKEVLSIDRRRESLSLYLWQAPRTPEERQQNKDTLDLAMKIRFEKEQELLENAEGYRLKKDRRIDFLVFFQNYINNYTKKDIRMVEIALSRFKDFLAESPDYRKFTSGIRPENLNKDMMLAFVDYLQAHSKGEGAKSIYQRFKKVITYAVDHEIIKKDPCKGISIKVDNQQLRKDVLSPEEIEQLISYHDPKQSPQIRRAFIFCLYCGLRFCDVKDLTFGNVDYSNKMLKFEQNKTKGHSAASGVIIPLSDEIITLVGKPAQDEDENSLIFKLPSYEMCNKSVKRWVKSAGIPKNISWHCARHSFAVNILNNGANIKTLASLLGHSGLKHTEKYTRAVDSLKVDAINSLPKLMINKV